MSFSQFPVIGQEEKCILKKDMIDRKPFKKLKCIDILRNESFTCWECAYSLCSWMVDLQKIRNGVASTATDLKNIKLGIKILKMLGCADSYFSFLLCFLVPSLICIHNIVDWRISDKFALFCGMKKINYINKNVHLFLL